MGAHHRHPTFLAAACALLAAWAGWCHAAVPAVAGGDRHSLAIRADGTLRAWGTDVSGELGSQPIYSSTPRPIVGLTQATQVKGGRFHSLARRGDGTVMGWGYNATGAIGDGTFTTRSSAGAVLIDQVTQVAPSGHFSLARRADGSVWGWGDNSSGQLGDGPAGFRPTPAAVPGITNVSSVAAGFSHTLALRQDGTVWTWGSNGSGELGTGAGPNRSTPAQVPGLTGVIAVSGGVLGQISAALKSDGTVWTWGSMGGASPVQAPGLTNVVAISAGRLHVIALRSDATVWAWGANGVGQLGDGTFIFRANPQPVPGLIGVVSIAVGSTHNLALLGDGTVRAWGSNAFGEIGDGTLVNRNVPTPVPSLGLVASITAGDGHSIVLRPDGTAVAWGSNLAGQLGDGRAINRTVSSNATTLTNVIEVSAGSAHNVALRQDGTVWTWGGGISGELGDGTFVSRAHAAQVTALPAIAQVTAGSVHAVARTAAGAVYAWGLNDRGQLGDNTILTRNVPVPVGGVSARAIGAGHRHSIAVAMDKTVWTWGMNNHGQLGDGSLVDRHVPVQVTGLTNVLAVAGGTFHTLALREDGTVWAWGANGAGELGEGTSTQRTSPVQVSGLANVIAIAAGQHRSMALKSDGTVWAWGERPLGDGTNTNASTPRQVPGLSNVAAIASGLFHWIVMLADGSLRTWGDNSFGAIGDGTYLSRPTPVVVLATNGAGSVDGNNWFTDLEPAVPSTIPAALTPATIAVAQVKGEEDRLTLDATVKHKSADIGKALNTYVVALVPAEFFGLVKRAPGGRSVVELKARAKSTLILAQLTPAGWTDASGQLIAYAQGVGNAAGGSARILDRINTTLIPGARFCIGYGETADSMLTSQALREVLDLEGSSGSASGVPCVLSGVYVSGPVSSLAGTSVRFDASVVGLSPGGNVQFRDGPGALLSPVALSAANTAVSRASITTAALTPGVHSIAAAYDGDGTNAAATTEIPLAHEVKPAPPGSSSIELSGPVSSQLSSEAVFTARVTGSSPTGTVQFRDGGSGIGAPEALAGGMATLRISTLAVGGHSITAAYGGDSGNVPSVSNAIAHTVHAVLGAAVTLASNANPSAFGSSVTLTAQVTGSAPTGSVTFLDGASVLASVPLSGSSASTAVSGLAAGVHVLTATYSGDAGNPAVTSSALIQQVRVQAPNTGPGPFAFAPIANVAPGSVVTSNTISVTGLGGPAPIVVAGGSYSIGCGASFTAASGTIAPGQTVCVRHNASASFGATTHTTLTIGGVSATLISTTYSSTFEAAVDSFVAHYYASILRRGADPSGQAFWKAEAIRVTALGASVNEAFYALAMTFYTSAEYAAFNRDDTGFVTDLYSTFFNRGPDAGGLTHWVGQLAQGMPREVALAEFMFSGEFASFTAAAFGNPAVRAEVNTVVDFYRGLLARLPDDGGLNFWVGRFRTAQCGGTSAVTSEVEAISSAFTLSGEYAARARTSTQYVGDLYNAFLRRGGDLGGVQFWINQIASGARTREQVRIEFKNSPEFQARVNQIIQQGCL